MTLCMLDLRDLCETVASLFLDACHLASSMIYCGGTDFGQRSSLEVVCLRSVMSALLIPHVIGCNQLADFSVALSYVT